jgi:hypothetical protein
VPSRQSRDESGPASADQDCVADPVELDPRRQRALFYLARWYKAKGWAVQARLPGWGRPPIIAGHLPDLYASDGEREVVIDLDRRPARPHERLHRAGLRVWQADQPDARSYAVQAIVQLEARGDPDAGGAPRIL